MPSTISQRSSQAEVSAAHSSNWLDSTPYLAAFPLLAHFLTDSPEFSGIAPQINELHRVLVSGSAFGGTHTKTS